MRCINNPLIPWSEAVLQNGVLQMKHGKALVESRPFFSRIPDQDILVGDLASGFSRAEADDWPQFRGAMNTTVVAASAEFQVLAKNNLNVLIQASPAISQGYFFIRSRDHIYCIRK